MIKYSKGIFYSLLCFFAFGAFSGANADQQNLSVTVDNSHFEIPDTPIIVRSENITTNTVNIVIEVGNMFSGQTLDFIVTATNVNTGDVVTFPYHQSVDGNARTTLSVVGLDPGTDYDLTVRYSQDGMNVYSAESNMHRIQTLIDPPIMDTITNVNTDSMTLKVVIDPVFFGSTMDFIVEVKNEFTGDTYTVQMTRDITSSSVSLDIFDLDPGTEYSFKVKYAREDSNNFSGYSNKKSNVTDLDPSIIVAINNIQSDSVDLDVEVDGSFSNENTDFVVQVTNRTTGQIFEIQFTQKVDGNDHVVLMIDGLSSGAEYDFKVKYARKGTNNFSGYSNSMNVRTNYYDDEEDGEMDVCHNGNTITISQSALQTHLDHGDYIGPCTPEGGDGGPHPEDVITPLGDDNGIVSGGSMNVFNDDILKSQKEKAREAIIPEEKRSTYETVGVIGAIAGSLIALAGSAIPLFAAMPGAFANSIFLKFIELFGIIGRRKEERNWGVVFDNVTHMPIPATKIVLSDQSGQEFATTYSDKDGRYGFLASPGTYVLTVFKKDYEVITDINKDELYGNVYDGKTVEMGEDHIILANIAMRSLVFNWAEYAKKKTKQYTSGFSTFKKYFFFVVYVFGFGATVLVTYFYPSIFNFCVLGLYLVLFIYQTFFKKKRYGSIETNGGNPVPFAVVSLHDDGSGEKKKFAVTDAIGRYYLLADNGAYKMKAKGQPVSGTSFEKQGDVKVNDGIVRKDIIV